jgi:hypothetical protein
MNIENYILDKLHPTDGQPLDMELYVLYNYE